jgi:hypothetical protein
MALRIFPLAPRATNTVFFADFAPQKGKRGKSVGKRVQHTPPTGTTLTEFRRFLNTDFGTLRMNAKSTHTFAPLTQKARKPLIQQVNFGNGHGMPLPQHSSPGSRLRGGPWRHQKSKHKASTETITLRCCTVPDKHTRPTPLDAHAVLPELGQASGTGGPLGDSRSVQRWFPETAPQGNRARRGRFYDHLVRRLVGACHADHVH